MCSENLNICHENIKLCYSVNEINKMLKQYKNNFVDSVFTKENENNVDILTRLRVEKSEISINNTLKGLEDLNMSSRPEN